MGVEGEGEGISHLGTDVIIHWGGRTEKAWWMVEAGRWAQFWSWWVWSARISKQSLVIQNIGKKCKLFTTSLQVIYTPYWNNSNFQLCPISYPCPIETSCQNSRRSDWKWKTSHVLYALTFPITSHKIQTVELDL